MITFRSDKRSVFKRQTTFNYLVNSIRSQSLADLIVECSAGWEAANGVVRHNGRVPNQEGVEVGGFTDNNERHYGNSPNNLFMKSIC